MKKILIFVLLIILCCGCNVNGTSGQKVSTLNAVEKENMIDNLTEEEQERIINALDLNLPDDIELSVRCITFYNFYDDYNTVSYTVELDGVEDYEAFCELNREYINSGRFNIGGQFENDFKWHNKEYYLTIMIPTGDLNKSDEYSETIKRIYEELHDSRN